jgi:TolA-binding protein
MKVVDIHPEELIDKASDGSLSLAERQRLDLHLAQCAICRFELAARADLAEDSPAFEQRPQLTFESGGRQQQLLAAPRQVPVPLSVRPRSRQRWPLSILAAALVLCAGGAMAAIRGGVASHWLPWSAAPSPAGSGGARADAKPSLTVKRSEGERPALASISEQGASSGLPVPSVAPPLAMPVLVSSAPVPRRRVEAVAPVVIAPLPRGRGEAALAAPEKLRSALAALPVSNNQTEVSATRPESAATLFADANRARRDGNADRAVALYRSLQSRYSGSSESELSRALLAQLLLERGNPEAALAGFDRYLSAGTPVLSAEALVGRARALEQLGKSTQAAAAWRQVQGRFPGSVHARLAATRLAALGLR